MKKQDDEQLQGQMSILDLIEEEPQSFEDYIGKCQYCMWYGYGLYDPYGKRRKVASLYDSNYCNEMPQNGSEMI